MPLASSSRSMGECLCLRVAAFLTLAIVAQAQVKRLEPISVDILENEWRTFTCNYDGQKDVRSQHELGVSVAECDSLPTMVTDPSEFQLVAAVFGVSTNSVPKMKSTFLKNTEPPKYYPNSQNKYVRDGLVEILNGDVNTIAIKVKASPRLDRICIACSQTASGFGFTETSRESLKIRKPPKVTAKVNGMAPQEPQVVPLSQSLNVTCEGLGPDKLTVRLMKSGQEVKSEKRSLTYQIANASRDTAGEYECVATTDLPFLVERGKQAGSTKFNLAVNFAPEFEVSEQLRYTQLNSRENIRINVRSYPEASLTCGSAPDGTVVRESYDRSDFVARYSLTLSLTDEINKEQTFECVAANSLGRRTLSITLTAKPPVPEITSGGSSGWHNSYQLHWRHHQNATIDRYEVEIAYLENGRTVNTTNTSFSPTAQKGSVALMEGKVVGNKLTHNGVLFGLNANREHNVRLRSCNQHGCSKYSPPVQVRTPAATDDNYNDPKNPVKASIGAGYVRGNFVVVLTGVCLLLAILGNTRLDV